jgi:hypothetical protein
MQEGIALAAAVGCCTPDPACPTRRRLSVCCSSTRQSAQRTLSKLTDPSFLDAQTALTASLRGHECRRRRRLCYSRCGGC